MMILARSCSFGHSYLLNSRHLGFYIVKIKSNVWGFFGSKIIKGFWKWRIGLLELKLDKLFFPLSLPNFGRFFKMEHACHVCIIDTALIYILEPTFDLIPTYLRWSWASVHPSNVSGLQYPLERANVTDDGRRNLNHSGKRQYSMYLVDETTHIIINDNSSLHIEISLSIFLDIVCVDKK